MMDAVLRGDIEYFFDRSRAMEPTVSIAIVLFAVQKLVKAVSKAIIPSAPRFEFTPLVNTRIR